MATPGGKIPYDDNEADFYTDISGSEAGVPNDTVVDLDSPEITMLSQADADLAYRTDVARPGLSTGLKAGVIAILGASLVGSIAYYDECQGILWLPKSFKVPAGVFSLIFSALPSVGMGNEIAHRYVAASEAGIAWLEPSKQKKRELIKPYVQGALAAFPITFLTKISVATEPLWEQAIWVSAAFASTAVMTTYSMLELMKPLRNELAFDKEKIKILKAIREEMLHRLTHNQGKITTLDFNEISAKALLASLLDPVPAASVGLDVSVFSLKTTARIGMAGYVANTAKVPYALLQLIFGSLSKWITYPPVGILTAFAIYPFGRLMLIGAKKVSSTAYKIIEAIGQQRFILFLREQIPVYNIYPKSTLAIMVGGVSLGSVTGFTNFVNSGSMTPDILKVLSEAITFGQWQLKDDFCEDIDHDSLGDSHSSGQDTPSSWDLNPLNCPIPLFVALCAYFVSMSFNIYYTLRAINKSRLENARFSATDPDVRKKAAFLHGAEEFIGKLADVYLGKLMLLLNEVSSQEMMEEILDTVATNKGIKPISIAEWKDLVEEIKVERAKLHEKPPQSPIAMSRNSQSLVPISENPQAWFNQGSRSAVTVQNDDDENLLLLPSQSLENAEKSTRCRPGCTIL